jgi:nucleoside-diphosphate-sugar epimerase
MKAFVAGATGVLGRRVVRSLVTAGVETTGIGRTPERRAELAEAGALAVELDLFARSEVMRAVAGHDVVFNLATAVPIGGRANRPGAWGENDRIRREGSRNLVDAALAAGARAYVQESVAFVYADGGHEYLDESAPVDATNLTYAALLGEAEAARFAQHGGTGITLRFGQFYGYDSGHTVAALNAARAGLPVELGPESAYRSPITTDDAASAVVAALTAPSGIYNVVDDRPLARAEFVDALASSLGVPTPTVRSVIPREADDLSVMLRSQRVSNRRFKEVTDWSPRSPSAWEGWVHVIADWRDSLTTHGTLPATTDA